jgi:hypothetical protein
MKIKIKTSLVSIEVEQELIDFTYSNSSILLVQVVNGVVEQANRLHNERERALEKALE